METIKTRFAPSPTGSLHVGGARTALFSYCIARTFGGQFLLRIEDTDRARHQEDAVQKIADDLRWLGFEWDEGIEVGGGHGPYRQSERLDIYRTHIETLLAAGDAYYCFETPEELDALREASGDAQGWRYPRPETLPTAEDAEAARAAGKPVTVRFRCPGIDVVIHDEIFGDVRVPGPEMDDFIIAKADGWPTYHLANVVDDALMGVTFILRGQEFLGQTWRHVLLRKALGFLEPRYAHLPLIMDMQGRKLSKRDGDVEVDSFRRAGYLPEAMVNFIALLGWNPGGDIETFDLAKLVDLFDISRVGKSNAKFDRDKLLAFNQSWAASLDETRLLDAFRDYLLRNEPADVGHIPSDDDQLLLTLLRACKGFRTFADIVSKAGMLFTPDDAYEFDDKAVKKVLDKGEGAGWAVLADLRGKLAEQEDWTPERIETFVKDYAEGNEIGMGKVAQPIRVAVTGSTISPGIGDTLSMLGQDKTLARIDRCLAEKKD